MGMREKAWTWVKGLLEAVGQEGVSTDLLEAVLKEVGYHDPYEVINSWSKEGRLAVVKGSRGDSNYHSRRYALPTNEAER
jgi:hypothetical protein